MGHEDVKYLVFDIESIPDSKLIKMVKYPDLDIDEISAVRRYQEEILNTSGGSTFFIPVTFQYPISICVAKVREDFSLIEMISLDEPAFRPKEMVRLYWQAVEEFYTNASLVTFNGRGFDIPLLELMAFRYGYTARRHFRDKYASRYRFGTKHIDLHDWLSNYNAIRMAGGLNLLAKVLGKPGKMDAHGEDVYDMFLEGKMEEINNYCFHDVLDTYFVFLRSRVMFGEITIEREQELVKSTREHLSNNVDKIPAFEMYLKNWGNWAPWPEE
ncbi:MAG: 3'-5' exonuclease [Spirochaetota bacterium]|nr:3'-5' exonuclease [Spirochaetota bacterium]